MFRECYEVIQTNIFVSLKNIYPSETIHLGECWSGPDDVIKYSRTGRADDRCVTSGYKKCPADPKTTDKECVGIQRANYVYGISMMRGNLQ